MEANNNSKTNGSDIRRATLNELALRCRSFLDECRSSYALSLISASQGSVLDRFLSKNVPFKDFYMSCSSKIQASISKTFLLQAENVNFEIGIKRTDVNGREITSNASIWTINSFWAVALAHSLHALMASDEGRLAPYREWLLKTGTSTLLSDCLSEIVMEHKRGYRVSGSFPNRVFKFTDFQTKALSVSKELKSNAVSTADLLTINRLFHQIN